MSKSIYSLVLSDDVVEAADRLAYELHTSRSALIDRILAEQLSCVTPEMRMQAVFARMEQKVRQFRVLEQTSAHARSLQTQLDYKYRPTVLYSVELYRAPREGEDGRLRVTLRTQNQALIAALDRFFRLWMALEERWVPAAAGTVYRIAPGRLERSIRSGGAKEDVFGERIGGYIRFFDSALRQWTAALPTGDVSGAAAAIEASFREHAEDEWI